MCELGIALQTVTNCEFSMNPVTCVPTSLCMLRVPFPFLNFSSASRFLTFCVIQFEREIKAEHIKKIKKNYNFSYLNILKYLYRRHEDKIL
jgi:hypothetical protein